MTRNISFYNVDFMTTTVSVARLTKTHEICDCIAVDKLFL